jgi:hypothetical protein
MVTLSVNIAQTQFNSYLVTSLNILLHLASPPESVGFQELMASMCEWVYADNLDNVSTYCFLEDWPSCTVLDYIPNLLISSGRFD